MYLTSPGRPTEQKSQSATSYNKGLENINYATKFPYDDV